MAVAALKPEPRPQLTAVPNQPTVALRDLTLAYGGGDPIIDNLSMVINPGQVYGLIGPSGCGKTTVIRSVLGLLDPTDGEVSVLGQSDKPMARSVRRRIGYVPQAFELYPNLTVAENLSVVGGLYGLGWIHRRRRIRETLELMELGDSRNKLARKLSGGMKRRLQLAAALLHEPDLLVVDEPTAGIDPILRARFWEEFRAIAESGRTVLFTTQYVNEAELCDSVALLAEGKLIAEGTPDQLRRKAFGGEVITVRSPALDWQVVAALAKLPFIKKVEQARIGEVVLLVEDGAEAAPEVVRLLEEGGKHVDATATEQPSFDEVFTRLVQA
jgi:ABC-2 type transport system ATP-binding protein